MSETESNIKKQLEKAGLSIFTSDNGSGADFIVKTKTGNCHEIHSISLNLDKDRSVKIPKRKVGELKENVWIGMVLLMTDMEPAVYLIPVKVFEHPDGNIFVGNDMDDRFSHFATWEIKVFKNGMKDLSQYFIDYMLPKFV